ncbi:hypothetical protein GCM10011348_33510 [Marinobacterium nitratireducens]|uniref:Outer membrane lipoprotein-sorting protein n=1 Tax=Marinobacterium nitratireducens TaxID=518897 RepID=A0A918DW84_9GAMM|nr:DUF1329 domain-containing protein [Marinobacterium nitratireducens]GGO85303.1 hypothetical protein GCM10011348_33510 [Marinobacterium nitratireducens]
MYKKTLICAAVTILSMNSVYAAISAEEAARLGGAELTPVGAERAGNADGTIPAWTGGLTQVPAGWRRGDDRPDPFAGEKPLFTITAGNVDQYADKLTPGSIALLKLHPEFRMPVYPTHRTAAWPQHVYDSIAANATTAKLVDDGNGVEGVWGAVPFPLPKNGNEVIWNHNLRFKGTYFNAPTAVANVVYDNGQRQEWLFETKVHYTYYDPGIAAKERESGDIMRYAATTISPARDAGEGWLALENIDAKTNPRKAWTYDPGERRVRRAPNLAFDTPDRPLNVIDDYDMFSGSPERYDWTLVGKREMYVPYNNNGLNSIAHSIEDVYTPGAVNSDLTRYELHRVWVVEAKLKPEARHLYAKRVFFIDEDSWTILATDKYDGNGNLWRVGFNYPVTAPEVPVTAGGFDVSYDLKVGGYYAITGVTGQDRAQTFDETPPEASYYSAAAMRRRGR